VPDSKDCPPSVEDGGSCGGAPRAAEAEDEEDEEDEIRRL
jgi:hypothetical protein